MTSKLREQVKANPVLKPADIDLIGNNGRFEDDSAEVEERRDQAQEPLYELEVQVVEVDLTGIVGRESLWFTRHPVEIIGNSLEDERVQVRLLQWPDKKSEMEVVHKNRVMSSKWPPAFERPWQVGDLAQALLDEEGVRVWWECTIVETVPIHRKKIRRDKRIRVAWSHSKFSTQLVDPKNVRPADQAQIDRVAALTVSSTRMRNRDRGAAQSNKREREEPSAIVADSVAVEPIEKRVRGDEKLFQVACQSNPKVHKSPTCKAVLSFLSRFAEAEIQTRSSLNGSEDVPLVDRCNFCFHK